MIKVEDIEMSNKQRPLLVILGPTATGKTELAVEVALLTNGEVISADSMLVYKHMDIGTAKPTLDECKGVPHHLINILNPDQEFSVARYQSMAKSKIKDIHARGKLPILAGGTGLYIQSILDGYKFGKVKINYKLREKMRSYAQENGNLALHNKLHAVDPETAARLHPNDLKRIIRALEIYHETGKKMSSLNKNNNINSIEQQNSIYNAYVFGLSMPREELYCRINKRVDQMLAGGLVDEVKCLLRSGYDTDLVSMQGLGYKEIAAYLKGEIDMDNAIYLIKRDTRRFAKRQLTWFRRDPRIKWFNIKDYANYYGLALEIIDQMGGLATSTSK